MRVLALPFRLTNGGSMETVPQNSPAEIAQSVGLLLATRPGERRVVPEYGSPDPLFAGASQSGIAAAISAWEPRADPAQVEIDENGSHQSIEVYPSEVI